MLAVPAQSPHRVISKMSCWAVKYFSMSHDESDQAAAGVPREERSTEEVAFEMAAGMFSRA